MARFAKKKKSALGKLMPFFSIVLTLLLVVAISTASTTLGDTAKAQQLTTIKDAVTKAAVHCYSIEGMYPPNMEYLERHYGLYIDRNKYMVDYVCFASNIMPDITVLPL